MRGDGQFRFFALLFVGFALLGSVVYGDALDGPFLSDDFSYIPTNPYVTQPGDGWWRAIFDPRAEPRVFVGGNYSPLVHVAHAIEWRLWGDQTRSYHLFNLLLHALNAALLAWALMRSGLSDRAAAVAGAIFLLHPANVEAVAWISQLKSLLAMAASLAAVVAFTRWPLTSPLWLGLGLLCKASAAFVLPILALFHVRDAGVARLRGQRLSLALCALVFCAFAPLQLFFFTTLTGDAYGNPYSDAWVQLRSIAGYGARYLAMAATGTGTAAFHTPAPAESLLDPWWLAGLAVAPLFVWRVALTLSRRSIEAGWWLCAAAGFAPISQIIPFSYPLADRWLYFILPGLLGGAAFALKDGIARFGGGRAGALVSTTLAVGILLALVFGAQARERTGLWQSIRSLYIDSAARYPDSAGAHYLNAVDSLRAGDRDGAIASLRESQRLGGHLLQDFHSTLFSELGGDPRYEQIRREVAGDQIDVARQRGVFDPLQLASWHLLRDELDEAIEVVRDAMRRQGPTPALVAALKGLRAERDRRER